MKASLLGPLLVVVVSSLNASEAAGIGEAVLTRLPDLPGGGEHCEAYGISADGKTVVGYSISDQGREAFRWTEETGIVGLGDLPGGAFWSWGWGVSADGSVVSGWGSTEAGRRAFRWTETTGLIDLGTLPGATSESQARDVSDDGEVIVGYAGSYGAGEIGFHWRDGVMTPIDDGVIWGFATSANGGAIVGRGDFGHWIEPYLWTAETGAFPLWPPPTQSIASTAYGISADGRVAVGAQASRAFRWTQETGLVLLDRSFLSSLAADASGDGSIVVGQRVRKAFLWEEASGMRELKPLVEELYDLDLTDYFLIHATAISNDGRTLAGYGGATGGSRECWVLTLPPACSDGRDNDADEAFDLDDLGCLDPEDGSEALRTDVLVEILPIRDRNPLLLGSRGPLRVAILGGPDVDLALLDAQSLVGGPGRTTPLSWPRPRLRDVDGDGFDDYTLAFPVDELELAPGDEEVCVFGDLDGDTFLACDTIQTLPAGCGHGFAAAPTLALLPLLGLRRRRRVTPRRASRSG